LEGEAVVPVLLTVGFVTMYLNDIQRSGFYAIGFDARDMTFM